MTGEDFVFPEIRIVEASAGAGKTFALAKRYVQLLLHPGGETAPDWERMRRILAITFTNKAAREMKSRILDFLKRTALGRMEPDELREILGPLDLPPDRAAVAAYRIMEGLIRNYNFFQVRTIDAFVNALLSGCAFRLGLSAHFRIRTDPQAFLTEGLDVLLSRAQENSALRDLFSRFLRHYLILENRTGWFPKRDMIEILMELYRLDNTYGLPPATGESSDTDLFRRRGGILARMRRLAALLPQGTDARFRRTLASFLDTHSRTFDIDEVSDYFAREEPPLRKGVTVDAVLLDAWRRTRADLREFCEAEARALPGPYAVVYREAAAEMARIASEADVLFLDALNRRARVLFDEEGITVEELYYRLATRFRHYLIDEFQDTSRIQWGNLELMVEEALASGGSLFCVGDRKQAIYGFRGGEARLFDEVPRRLGVFPLRRERLVRNYRSHPVVVAFVNTVFSLDNLRAFLRARDRRDAGRGKKPWERLRPADFSAVEAVFRGAGQEPAAGKTGGCVRVEELPGETREQMEEAARERLLACLGDLRSRFSDGEIAVLTRGNAQVAVVSAWLMEAGIPVDSERTRTIREHALIREILAFLRFLHRPIDDEAFASFIGGDLFARVSGRPARDWGGFLFSQRALLASGGGTLYRCFREAHPSLWEEFFETFFRNAGLYPLYELVGSIVHRFGVLGYFPEEQGAVMRLLEVVKRREEEGTDLASFLEAYEALPDEDLYVEGARRDAVGVLTIHKAKGLEFPAVVVPFLGIDVHPGTDRGAGYLPRLKTDRVELLRIKSKHLRFAPRLAALHRRACRRSLAAELNTIYVALTRAREEIHVFIPRRVGRRRNPADLLIPEACRRMGEPDGGRVGRPTVVEGPWFLSPSEGRDWIAYLKEEFRDEASVLHREERRLGEFRHAVLAGLGDLTGRDPAKALGEALAAARDRFPGVDDAAAGEVRDLVGRLLRREDLRPVWEGGRGAEVLCEFEVLTAEGGMKRMDRVIVRPGEVWVVDFKSSGPFSEDARRQVVRYAGILSDLYPDRRVRGFLLSLSEGRCEEIPWSSREGA